MAGICVSHPKDPTSHQNAVVMKQTHKRNRISIAMAAIVLVSLWAVGVSPLGVSAAGGSSTYVQAPTLVGGPVASAPAACAQDGNSLDVFVQGADHALWYIHYQAGSGWSVWKSLGGVLTSDPAAVSRGAGKIDVFVRGNDGALWSRYTLSLIHISEPTRRTPIS